MSAAAFVLILMLLPGHGYAKGDNMAGLKKAYFAGGCFWCMEAPFEKVNGVTNVDAGYANSKVQNPTYEQVSKELTAALEAVEVTYDPSKVSFEDLLNVYWTTIDPTQADGQFGDRGSQYLPAILYQNEEEKFVAQESKNILEESKIFKKPIVVEIIAFEVWNKAEKSHQDYHKTNTQQYLMYNANSGRKPFLDQTWNKKPYCPIRRVSPEKLKEIQAKHGK